jgi:hypothetical protein
LHEDKLTAIPDRQCAWVVGNFHHRAVNFPRAPT